MGYSGSTFDHWGSSSRNTPVVLAPLDEAPSNESAITFAVLLVPMPPTFRLNPSHVVFDRYFSGNRPSPGQ
jgi:hypothetical protein